jgi:hypothetical protein
MRAISSIGALRSVAVNRTPILRHYKRGDEFRPAMTKKTVAARNFHLGRQFSVAPKASSTRTEDPHC